MKTNTPHPVSGLTELETLAVAAAGELAQSLSLNRLVAQLYALLYLSPEPLSLGELARKLAVSKASASINIRVLEEWNAVSAVWVQGTRQDFYRAEPDFVKVIADRLEQGLAKRLALVDARLENARRLASGQGTNASFYKERLRKVEEVRATAGKALKLLPLLRGKGALRALRGLL